MSWIESHQALRDHPKTKRLARRVGGLASAIGHLHCLWWWCLDYAPNGDLVRYDAEDIAIACEWDGEPEEIVAALTECGFLDASDEGLKVHDWTDWGGSLVKRRAKDAERKRQSRSSAVRETSDGRRTDGARTHKHTHTQSARGREAVDNSQQPARAEYCDCGCQLQTNGDGSDTLRCPVCEPAVIP